MPYIKRCGFTIVLVTALGAIATACVTAEPAPQPAPQPASPWVALRVGPCFGDCPTYLLKVWRDGRATFEGTERPCLVGKFSAEARRDKVEDLFNAVASVDLDAKPRTSRSAVMGVVDASRFDLELERDGKVKQILLRRGGPGKPEYAAIEAAFAALKKSSEWHETGAKTGATKSCR